MKIYSRFNRPASPALSGFSPTLTQQQFKEESDINTIVKRAINAQDLSIFTPVQRQQFLDSSMYQDYQTSLDTVRDIEDDFYSLPSDVRKEFNNDPDTFVSFMVDPENHAKAVELGLLQPSGDGRELDRGQTPEVPAVAPPEEPAFKPNPE